MKKVLEVLVIVVVVLWIGLGFLAVNPQWWLSQKILPLFMTNTPVVETGALQTTGIDLTNCISYFDGCNNCSVKDGKVDACILMFCETPSEPKCLEYATTGSDLNSWWLAEQKETKNNINYSLNSADREKIDCGNKIWDISNLISNITSQKLPIKTLTIKQECWQERTIYNKDEYLKTNQDEENIKYSKGLYAEDEEYIVYTLVDTTWDIPNMEYPIIVYNKKEKTNKLLILRSGFPVIWWISKDWKVTIENLFYEKKPKTFDLMTNAIIKN
jgi:hypothetical protein